MFLFNLIKIIEFHLKLNGYLIVLMSLIVSYIVYSLTKNLLVATARILLNGTAVDDQKTIMIASNSILHIHGILNINKFFVWSLNSSYYVCSVEI